MLNKNSVICFGEVLWDCAPKGLFLGGGPCNVAYHLHSLGVRVVFVSAVGDDFLGDEIKRRLSRWKISTEFVGSVEGRQTGVVQVDLTDPSNPAYDIVDDVAWDRVTSSPRLDDEARSAKAIVYGSLTLRHEGNGAVLSSLLAATRALKVFDVNLRPPHFDRQHVLELAASSNLVKVNEDELTYLYPGANHSLSEQAANLSILLKGVSVCVTCGSRGAGMWYDSLWHWCEARQIETTGDAVGAGDAFLAALVYGLVSGDSIPTALSRGCRLAELVAGSDGATPIYDSSSFLSI
jgi:fructokinase